MIASGACRLPFIEFRLVDDFAQYLSRHGITETCMFVRSLEGDGRLAVLTARVSDHIALCASYFDNIAASKKQYYIPYDQIDVALKKHRIQTVSGRWLSEQPAILSGHDAISDASSGVRPDSTPTSAPEPQKDRW